MRMTVTPFDPGLEFDRQVGNLLDRGYPQLCGLTGDGFAAVVAPLRQVAVERATRATPPTPARVPFALVITAGLVSPERAVPLLALKGKAKPGIVDRHYAPGDLARFEPIKELEIPAGQAYLALDVDRGEQTLNLAPDDATAIITGQGRTPLTVAEGIAFATHFPEALEKNKCFSLAGSRCGDRRVPALWISAGAPKLGWCWAGNPHTWLGSASCGGRAGAPAVLGAPAVPRVAATGRRPRVGGTPG
jgi:hypothetical protein